MKGFLTQKKKKKKKIKLKIYFRAKQKVAWYERVRAIGWSGNIWIGCIQTSFSNR
jgi:hypothetical protein